MARTKRALRNRCRWRYDVGDDAWCAACGAMYQFSEGGGPAGNGFRFCYHCGGEIVVTNPREASAVEKLPPPATEEG